MFLTERLADGERYAGLELSLPEGVIHGDASIGNVCTTTAALRL